MRGAPFDGVGNFAMGLAIAGGDAVERLRFKKPWHRYIAADSPKYSLSIEFAKDSPRSPLVANRNPPNLLHLGQE